MSYNLKNGKIRKSFISESQGMAEVSKSVISQNEVEKNLSHLEEIIDKCRNDNYENVTDSQRQEFKPWMDFLVQNYNQDETARNLCLKLIQRMNLPNESLNKKIEETFNLSNYLTLKIEDIYKVSSQEWRLWREIVKNEPITYGLRCKELYCTSSPVTDAEEYNQLKRKTDKVLKDIIKAPEQTNRQLANMLLNNPVELEFSDNDDIEGEMKYKKTINGFKKPVLSLHRGAVNSSPDMLAMLISHELGHWMDMAERPEGYQGMLEKGQEHFADIIGQRLCINAGYNPQEFIDLLKSKNNPFLKERAELLQQFPEDTATVKCNHIVTYANDLYEKTIKITENLGRLVKNRSPQANMNEAINMLIKQKQANTPLDAVEMINKSIQTDFENLSNKDISKEDFKKKYVERIALNSLQKEFFEQHMNMDYNIHMDDKLNKGYCTVALMKAMEQADNDGIMKSFLPTNKEISSHPKTLIDYFQNAENGKFADYVTHTEKGQGLNELIKDRKIKPGALVVLTMSCQEGETPNLDGQNHAVLYCGNNPQTGKCQFLSFNNERKDWEAEKFKYGYVVDTYGLIKQAEKERQTQRQNNTHTADVVSYSNKGRSK